MSDFEKFRVAVNTAFATLIRKDDSSKNHLFLANVSGDELYDHYLASFPEGSNPMFRERTEHDCSTCKNFIRNLGGLVFMNDNLTLTVWDAKVEDPIYSVVASEMSEFVKSRGIKQHFIVGESAYGAEKNIDADGRAWKHFHGSVPRIYTVRGAFSNEVGRRGDDVAILRRSLNEITDSAVDVVMELIDQNSIYRGAEFRTIVKEFQSLKSEYRKLKSDEQREKFVWLRGSKLREAARVRNTVIGTLLTDLSEGVDLEKAVASFEAKVAPTNYKRPKAVVTQKMIDNAKKTVEELGIEESLYRRYAVKGDVSANNVLFVDGSVKPLMLGGVFDDVKPTKNNIPKFDNVESISIADFIDKVLPKATSVEAFVKSEHANHFVSLIASVHPEAAPLFKWGNSFSWSYEGEVADSIKERVKKAGGKVDGYMRVSLSWHNPDDLDLSVSRKASRNSREELLYFGDKCRFGAELDVDMNAFGKKDDHAPVENIVWKAKKNVADGTYTISVNNYCQRSTDRVGFEVEVEVAGVVYSYVHPNAIRSGTSVKVGTITVEKGVISVSGMSKGSPSSEKWGVTTESWVPVEMIMRSPNCWDGKKVGNEHIFFMLKGCANPEDTRGFYNEFLRDDLLEHRKVFELLASKLKAVYNDNQLSGIGISTTKKEELLVRVKGSVSRVLKVIF